jgi:hypothetical protein
VRRQEILSGAAWGNADTPTKLRRGAGKSGAPAGIQESAWEPRWSIGFEAGWSLLLAGGVGYLCERVGPVRCYWI